MLADVFAARRARSVHAPASSSAPATGAARATMDLSAWLAGEPQRRSGADPGRRRAAAARLAAARRTRSPLPTGARCACAMSPSTRCRTSRRSRSASCSTASTSAAASRWPAIRSSTCSQEGRVHLLERFLSPPRARRHRDQHAARQLSLDARDRRLRARRARRPARGRHAAADDARGGPPVELFRFTDHGAAVAFLAEALTRLAADEPLASVAVLTPSRGAERALLPRPAQRRRCRASSACAIRSFALRRESRSPKSRRSRASSSTTWSWSRSAPRTIPDTPHARRAAARRRDARHPPAVADQRRHARRAAAQRARPQHERRRGPELLAACPMHPPTGDETAADVAALHADGWVVIPELLPAPLLADMRAALAPYLRRERSGRNDFEGYRTDRIYSLVALRPLFDRSGRAPAHSGHLRRAACSRTICSPPRRRSIFGRVRRRRRGTATMCSTTCRARGRRSASRPSGRWTRSRRERRDQMIRGSHDGETPKHGRRWTRSISPPDRTPSAARFRSRRRAGWRASAPT